MPAFYRLVEACARSNGNRTVGECPNDLTRARSRFGRCLTEFENKLLTLDRVNAIHCYRCDALVSQGTRQAIASATTAAAAPLKGALPVGRATRLGA
jgi:hypothetical protein